MDWRWPSARPVNLTIQFYKLLGYKGDVDLEAKLDERERFYNFARPHGVHNGQTPYEALREKLQQHHNCPAGLSSLQCELGHFTQSKMSKLLSVTNCAYVTSSFTFTNNL